MKVESISRIGAIGPITAVEPVRRITRVEPVRKKVNPKRRIILFWEVFEEYKWKYVDMYV